jgi:HK97 gp10 family phage protein
MVRATVTVTKNKLPLLSRYLPGAVNRRARKAADQIKDGAVRRSRVDTGEMRDGWQVEGEDGQYTVYNDVEHAVYNEYGTAHMTAAPMLHPAVDEVAAKTPELFAGVFEEAMGG